MVDIFEFDTFYEPISSIVGTPLRWDHSRTFPEKHQGFEKNSSQGSKYKTRFRTIVPLPSKSIRNTSATQDPGFSVADVRGVLNSSRNAGVLLFGGHQGVLGAHGRKFATFSQRVWMSSHGLGPIMSGQDRWRIISG